MLRLLQGILILSMTGFLSAAIITINVDLSPAQEVPAPMIPPPFDPSGTTMLTIDTIAGTVDGTLEWMDMTTPVIMAHIHRHDPGELVGPPVHTFFSDEILPQTDTYTTGGPVPL